MTKPEPKRLSDLAVAPRKDMVMLDPTKICIEKGFNVRNFDRPTLKESDERLKASIKAKGLETPIEVRYEKGQAILVDGERRMRAVLKLIAEGHKIPAVPAYSALNGARDEVSRIVSLTTKNDGMPLSLLEQAEVVHKLKEHKLSEAEISKRLDYSPGHINNLVKLIQAPPKIKEYIIKERISASNVIEIIRQFGAEKALEQVETSLSAASAKGSTRATPRHARATSDDGIVWGKTSMRSLISSMQELYAMLVPANDFRKERSIIRNTLENIGAPLEPEVEEDDE